MGLGIMDEDRMFAAIASGYAQPERLSGFLMRCQNQYRTLLARKSSSLREETIL